MDKTIQLFLINFVPEFMFKYQASSQHLSESSLVKCLSDFSRDTIFHMAQSLHASSSLVTIPPFAVLNLTPKSPSGPPWLWLAVRIIPPMALYFLITQEMAGVDIIPWCPMIRRPT